jgi:hypothetical protein
VSITRPHRADIDLTLRLPVLCLDGRAQAHRQGLSRLGSNLEFQLVRLQYLLLLLNRTPGSGQEGLAVALQLAQERFAEFAHANMEEVGHAFVEE